MLYRLYLHTCSSYRVPLLCDTVRLRRMRRVRLVIIANIEYLTFPKGRRLRVAPAAAARVALPQTASPSIRI